MIRRWRQLAAAERRTLVSAALLTTLFRVALLVLPWRVVARFVRPRVRLSRDAAAAERVRWAFAVCDRRLPWASCLPQSLAAHVLLARAGLPSEVRIGTWREADGSVHFHASVESDGFAIYGVREMTTLATIGVRGA